MVLVAARWAQPRGGSFDAHLAAFDDCGGHVNPHIGYHYHAATGCSDGVVQSDGHAPMIGYAADGFGVYSMLDHAGQETAELDECLGHEDETRGYHHHVASAGMPGG